MSPRTRNNQPATDVIASFLVVVGLAFFIGLYKHRAEEAEFEKVTKWLKQNDLLQFNELFFKHGYTSLYLVSKLTKLKAAGMLKQSIFKESPRKIIEYINSVMIAKEAMIEEQRFNTWLISNRIEHLRDDIMNMEIKTLGDAVEKIDMLKASEYMKAYDAFMELEIYKDSLHRYPVFYNSLTFTNIVYALFSWFFFLAKLIIALSVILALIGFIGFKILIRALFSDFRRLMRRNTATNPTRRRGFFDAFRHLFSSNQNRGRNNGTDSTVPDERRYGFFDSLLGRTLCPKACVVTWNTKELMVGNEFILTVQFFARNRNPYKSSELMSIKCEVIYSRYFAETAIVHSQEHDHEISIHFTPTAADVEYVISILADGEHVAESPFRRTFKPGELDPAKSSLVVPSSLLVLEQGKQEQLKFDERDKYGNIIMSNVENLLNYEFIFHEFVENGQRVFPFLTFNSQKEYFSRDSTTAGLTVMDAGVFTVDVSYNNEPFSTGVVLLVLTGPQMSEVNKNISNTPYSLYYEAYMFSSYKSERKVSYVTAADIVLPSNFERTVTYVQPTDTAKRKKVYVYINPKFITIKEFYMRIFAKRSYAFRIKPSVTIELHSGDYEDGECFTIQSSSTGQPYTLYCPQRNIVVATFVKLLLKNIGGSENFQDKKRYFQRDLYQLAASKTNTKLLIKIDRETMLKDSMRVLKVYNKSAWWKHFHIKFEGELGMDCGGVSREWFHLVLERLFSTESGCLFRCFNKDDSQALIHPNPYRKEEFQKLRFYEFAGQMVGKCLVECACSQQRQQFVKARFTRSFLAQLLGVEITWKFFETDDKALYNGKVKHILENDPDGLDIFFCEDVYDQDDNFVKTIELKPNGSDIQVLEENKLEYLQRMAEYRLQESVKQEIASFHKGLTSIVDDGLLSIFDENELELLICGMDMISVSDMKANCDATQSEQMNQFWSILSGFSQEELSRLLQFITGCSQLPPEGFVGLTPRLQIRVSYQENYLPVSHTCMNLLILPLFNSTEELRRKIILAITEGSEGFGLV